MARVPHLRLGSDTSWATNGRWRSAGPPLLAWRRGQALTPRTRRESASPRGLCRPRSARRTRGVTSAVCFTLRLAAARQRPANSALHLVRCPSNTTESNLPVVVHVGGRWTPPRASAKTFESTDRSPAQMQRRSQRVSWLCAGRDWLRADSARTRMIDQSA